MQIAPVSLALIAVAVFLSAVLRGFTGFGFALAAVPLISLVEPPAGTVALVILLQIWVGLRDTVRIHAMVDRPSLIRLVIGALIGTPVGIYALSRLEPSVTRLAIAAIVCLGAIFLARKPSAGAKGRLAVPAGLLSGIFGGLAAMPGPPAVAFYLSLPITPRVARASLIVFFFCTSLIALPGLMLAGLVDGPTFALSLGSLPLVLLGTALGTLLFRRSSDAGYRRFALAVLVALAIGTGVRGALELFMF